MTGVVIAALVMAYVALVSSYLALFITERPDKKDGPHRPWVWLAFIVLMPVTVPAGLIHLGWLAVNEPDLGSASNGVTLAAVFMSLVFVGIYGWLTVAWRGENLASMIANPDCPRRFDQMPARTGRGLKCLPCVTGWSGAP